LTTFFQKFYAPRAAINHRDLVITIPAPYSMGPDFGSFHESQILLLIVSWFSLLWCEKF